MWIWKLLWGFLIFFHELHSTAGSIMGPAVAQNYLLCSSPHKRGWPGRHGNTTDAWPWHLKDLCLSRGSRARKRWAEYYEAGSVVLCSWNQFAKRTHTSTRAHTHPYSAGWDISVPRLKKKKYIFNIPLPFFAWRKLANWRAGFVRLFFFFCVKGALHKHPLFLFSCYVSLFGVCLCVPSPLIQCPPLPILLLCLR